MEPGEDKFINSILIVNKLIIKVLVCILTVCLILAIVNLCTLIYKKIIEPPFLAFETDTIFNVFSLILIIAIGYKLAKSFLIIISSQSIPSFPIVTLAIIAVANKKRTLVIKYNDSYKRFGLVALMAELGITYFFHKFKTLETKADE